uniref:Luciferin 4-monooxygenase n=1 Tax=Crassostrea virginica TaxID=6565 RepID=A0A8B8DSW3_CRAVI|nr:4-coumarate--CoA ligase-like [Crassostrea virginica]XP_022331328.1 4-coumarate--CoA ligase-like [Crassostrea virginica]
MSSIKKMKQLEKGTRFLLKSFSTVRNGRRGSLCVSHPVNFRQFSSSAVLSNVYSSRFGDLKLEQKPLGQFMLERFEKYGDKVALVDFPTDRKYTYAQLRIFIVKVASALTRLGYKKGDVICIHSVNIPEFSILLLAAASAGIIVTTSNPAYTAGELSRQLEHSKAKAVFTIPQLVPVVRDAIESGDSLTDLGKNITVFGESEGCRPFATLMQDDGAAFPENVNIDPLEDVCVLPYSSGTTGLPKGVMLTHDNLVANLQQFRPILKVTEEDTSLGILPFFHIYGMCPVMMGVLIDGGKLVTLPKFEPEMFLKALEVQKVTQLHIVPPIVLFLGKHPMVSNFDISCLKAITSGAAPLGEGLTNEVMDRLKAVIRQGYGLTETSPVTHLDVIPPTCGTIGCVIPNTLCRVLNPETDEDVPEGEVGEICIRGPQVMKGYLNNEKATDEMIRNGWLHTGDIGHYVKERGVFMITDRLKELIKYKGNQVAPAELEDLLLQHPAVQDVAVIGLPDEDGGEVPMAYIVKKANQEVSSHDITSFVEGKVAHYKRLRGGVEFIDQIPKSPSGKILRRILKESLPKSV